VTCHEHQIETFSGVKSGAFIAPDHEYPAHLRLELTVTDSGGLTDSQEVDILPQTTTLTVNSNVNGATLAVDGSAGPGPLTKTVIVGSSHVVTAPLQQVSGTVYDFDNWSDAGAQSHNLTVGSATTLNASMSTRSVSATNTQVLEGAANQTTTVNVPVTLDHAATRPVTVQWATQNGTATAGSDYTAATGSVVIPAGATQATISVSVIGDNTLEGNETFKVVLSAPENANLGNTGATVTIVDDDSTPTISGSFTSMTEGNSGSSINYIPVTLSRTSAQTITVQYLIVDFGTTPGVDYSASPGTLTFAPGETVKSVPITVFGDKLNEADEAVVIALTNPTNATLNPNAKTGALTIKNDDPVPQIVGNAAAVTEGNSGTTPISIPVTLSAVSGQKVTVNWVTYP
jgi:chitinase